MKHLILLLFLLFFTDNCFAQVPKDAPKVGIILEKKVAPNQPIKALLRHTNVDSIQYKIYRIDNMDFYLGQWYYIKKDSQVKNMDTIYHSPPIILEKHTNEEIYTEIALPPISTPSYYKIEIQYKYHYKHLKKRKTEIAYFEVNPLRSLRYNNLDSLYIYLVNATTGKPYKNWNLWGYKIDLANSAINSDNFQQYFEWQIIGKLDENGHATIARKDLYSSLEHSDSQEPFYISTLTNLAIDSTDKNRLVLNEYVPTSYQKKYHYDQTSGNKLPFGNPKVDFMLDKTVYKNGDNIHIACIARESNDQNYFSFLNPKTIDLEMETDSYYAAMQYEIYITVGLFDENNQVYRCQEFKVDNYSLVTEYYDNCHYMPGKYTLRVTDIELVGTDTILSLKLSELPAYKNRQHYGAISFEVIPDPSESPIHFYLKSPQKHYHINDSILIEGQAIGIPDSMWQYYQINYSVVQNIAFPDRLDFDWNAGTYDRNRFFYPKYSPKKQLIKEGGTQLNSNKQFFIPFVAQQHQAHNSNTEYYYTITAKITATKTHPYYGYYFPNLHCDIKRPFYNKQPKYASYSCERTIRIQESSIDINVAMPLELLAHKDYQIPIEINSHKQTINTTKIDIYSVQTPPQFKHIPIWKRPTNFSMNQIQHDSIFDHAAYYNEYAISECQLGHKVLETNFDSKNRQTFDISSYQFKEGDYVLLISCYDSLLQKEVSSKHYFRYFDFNQLDSLHCSVPFFVEDIDTNLTMNDSLSFCIANGKKEAIQVLFRLEKEGKNMLSQWIPIQKKTICKLPIKKAYTGQLCYYIDAMIDGRWFSKKGTIHIQHHQPSLSIEYLKLPKRIKRGHHKPVKVRFPTYVKSDYVRYEHPPSIRGIFILEPLEDAQKRPALDSHYLLERKQYYFTHFDNTPSIPLNYSYLAQDYSYDTITYGCQEFECDFPVVENLIPNKVFIPISYTPKKYIPASIHTTAARKASSPILFQYDDHEVENGILEYPLHIPKQCKKGWYQLTTFAISNDLKLTYALDKKLIKVH
ncbi:MAG: hypothetical protein MK212_12180 [Saprospiraceae bacterium]|nr:hypothetical protein [Saprospiraceae bacterium]